jgi:hypothetical protein
MPRRQAKPPSAAEIKKYLTGQTFLALDTETSQVKDEVLANGMTQQRVLLQVGGVRSQGLYGKKVEHFEHLVTPHGQGVNINKEWMQAYTSGEAFRSVHGIDPLGPGAKSLEDVRATLSRSFPLSGNNVLLAYNAPYDMKVLRDNLKWSPAFEQQKNVIDVLKLARRELPGLKSYKQEDVARALGIKVAGKVHQAGYDAQLTMEIFKKLAKKRNSSAMSELRRIYGITSTEKWYENRRLERLAKKYAPSTPPAPTRGVSPFPRISSLGEGHRKLIYEPGNSPFAPTNMEIQALGKTHPHPKTGLTTATRLISESDASQLTMHTSRGPMVAANISRAGEEATEIARRSWKIQDIEDYHLRRAMEESPWAGAHSRGVLKTIAQRASFWSNVGIRNYSESFINRLPGLSPAEKRKVLSGRLGTRGRDKQLRALLALEAANFEVTGSVKGSTGRSGRLINYGRLEPGAHFVGVTQQGTIMSVLEEQQKAMMETMFGRSRKYIYDKSRRVVPLSAMKKIRIMGSHEGLSAVSQYGDMGAFRRKLRAELGQLRKLAKMEAAGQIFYSEELDPLVGGTRQSPLSIYYDNEEEQIKGLLESTESKLPGANATAEELAGLSKEEMSQWAANLTGETGSLEGASEPGAVFGKESEQLGEEAENVASGADNPAQALARKEAKQGYVSVDTRINPKAGAYREMPTRYYQDRYARINRALKGGVVNKVLHKEIVKRYGGQEIFDLQNKKGEKVRKKVRDTYNAEIRQLYQEEIQRLGYVDVNLALKSPEQIEEIIAAARDKIGGNGRLKLLVRGSKSLRETAIDIHEQDIGTLAELNLSSEDGRSDAMFSKIKNDVPTRARAEDVFDIYFSKKTGSTRYAGYTASGTYLGDTFSDKKLSPIGRAKLFKDDYGNIRVGWFSGGDAQFNLNQYGAVESQKTGGVKQIRSFLDVPKENRLQMSRDVADQEKLKRMYEQENMGDFALISKYKQDMQTKAWVDASSGQKVDEKIVNEHRATIEKQYRSRFMADEAVARRSMLKTAATPAAGKETSLLDRFLSSSAKNKTLVVGAMVAAAVLLTSKGSMRKMPTGPGDVPGGPYGDSDEDGKIFQNRRVPSGPARVSMKGAVSGYTTNIQVDAEDMSGINPSELASIMDRHAKNVLGTKSGHVNVNITDNSDRATQYGLQRKYENMLRD